MSKKLLTTKLLAAVGVAAGLTLAGVLPATAAETSSVDSGSLTAIAPDLTLAPAPQTATADAAALEKLQALSHTQTAAEIAAIRASGGDIVSLRNEAGDVIAAYNDEAKMTAFAIDQHAYCGSSDACAWTNGGASPWGFSGSGQLSTALNNTTKIQAGNLTTTFWFGATSGDYVGAWETAYVPNRNYSSVTRK